MGNRFFAEENGEKRPIGINNGKWEENIK